eukprot:403345618
MRQEFDTDLKQQKLEEINNPNINLVVNEELKIVSNSQKNKNINDNNMALYNLSKVNVNFNAHGFDKKTILGNSKQLLSEAQIGQISIGGKLKIERVNPIIYLARKKQEQLQQIKQRILDQQQKLVISENNEQNLATASFLQQEDTSNAQITEIRQQNDSLMNQQQNQQQQHLQQTSLANYQVNNMLRGTYKKQNYNNRTFNNNSPKHSNSLTRQQDQFNNQQDQVKHVVNMTRPQNKKLSSQLKHLSTLNQEEFQNTNNANNPAVNKIQTQIFESSDSHVENNHNLGIMQNDHEKEKNQESNQSLNGQNESQLFHSNDYIGNSQYQNPNTSEHVEQSGVTSIQVSKDLKSGQIGLKLPISQINVKNYQQQNKVIQLQAVYPILDTIRDTLEFPHTQRSVERTPNKNNNFEQIDTSKGQKEQTKRDRQRNNLKDRKDLNHYQQKILLDKHLKAIKSKIDVQNEISNQQDSNTNNETSMMINQNNRLASPRFDLDISQEQKQFNSQDQELMKYQQQYETINKPIKESLRQRKKRYQSEQKEKNFAFPQPINISKLPPLKSREISPRYNMTFKYHQGSRLSSGLQQNQNINLSPRQKALLQKQQEEVKQFLNHKLQVEGGLNFMMPSITTNQTMNQYNTTSIQNPQTLGSSHFGFETPQNSNTQNFTNSNYKSEVPSPITLKSQFGVLGNLQDYKTKYQTFKRRSISTYAQSLLDQSFKAKQTLNESMLNQNSLQVHANGGNIAINNNGESRIGGSGNFYIGQGQVSIMAGVDFTISQAANHLILHQQQFSQHSSSKNDNLMSTTTLSKFDIMGQKLQFNSRKQSTQ